MNTNIHFSKKYRIKSFNTIIGQKLIVKFLKNSIFKGLFHPVYIFSGLRGTGKTSISRIFAASLLCHNRNQAKGNSSYILPCDQCTSCISFKNGAHPDFFEFDAASHSGVDSIREIIDHASFLPLVSDKKIYVIDEVHMLSKAAFNACLKIMEEPPAFVHFILATTNVEKVLDTILSRSIHLIFDSISIEDISDYLENICIQENISYEKEGINYIAKMSEGSIRDSLHLMERIYILYESLKTEDVINTLKIVDQDLIKQFINTCCNESENSLELFFSSIKSSSRYILWKDLIDILINTIKKEPYNSKLTIMLSKCIAYEKYFFESMHPENILKLIYYEMLNNINNSSSEDKKNNNKIEENSEPIKKNIISKELPIIQDKTIINETTNTNFSMNNKNDLCLKFIAELSKKDTVLSSLFQQGILDYDEKEESVKCHFDKKFSFYKDFIEDKKQIWNTIFVELFGNYCKLEINFLSNLNPAPKNESILEAEKKPISYPNPTYSNPLPLKKDTAYTINKYPYDPNKKNIQKSPVLEKDKGDFALHLNSFIPGKTEYL